MRSWNAGNLSVLLWTPACALTFLSAGFGCEAQNGTDSADDCSNADCEGDRSTGGRVSSGGSSSGGQPPSTGGAASGGDQASGGAAGAGQDADEEARRDACLSQDPDAEFGRDEDGCWVCEHDIAPAPEELEFESPQCFDYGFQLRRVELGCGYLITSWSGDVTDSYYNVYAVTEPFEGLGGVQDSGPAPFKAVLVRRGGASNGTCSYDHYGAPVPLSCDSWTTICKGY